jgi:hypothetical protein
MIREIGELHLPFPLWFLAETEATPGESTNAMGLRRHTGFLMLPLFTSENLAKRFADDQHLKNAVIAKVDDSRELVDFLRNASNSFAHVVLDPPKYSPMSLEYLLTKMVQQQR